MYFFRPCGKVKCISAFLFLAEIISVKPVKILIRITKIVSKYYILLG